MWHGKGNAARVGRTTAHLSWIVAIAGVGG